MTTEFDNIEDNPIRITRQKLMDDLRILTRDADELLRTTAGELGEKLGERAKAARARLAQALDGAKETCQNLQDRTSATARVADETIRAHPYQSVGIAFGVGILIGVLIARR